MPAVKGTSMRKVLAFAIAATVLAGVMAAGGCVDAKEYDRVVAMNRQAQDSLDQALDRQRLLEAERAALEAKIADYERTIAFKQNELDLLGGANKKLLADLDALKAQLAKLQNAAPLPLPGPVKLPALLNEKLMQFAKENPDLLEYFPRDGMVKFKADLTFAKGSDEVTADAKAALAKLAGILSGSEAADFAIWAVGHTDDIPLKNPATIERHGSNLGLSTNRAVSVFQALDDGGMDVLRIRAGGVSKYHPVEANAPGEKGNPANRRVELWIVPKELLLTAN